MENNYSFILKKKVNLFKLLLISVLGILLGFSFQDSFLHYALLHRHKSCFLCNLFAFGLVIVFVFVAIIFSGIL
jgi:hypothetical protein